MTIPLAPRISDTLPPITWEKLPADFVLPDEPGEVPAIVIENLGLKPRRSTTALPLNISTFTEYMLKCSPWKKPIGFDFTPHPNKSRYCGALWAV